MDNRSVKGLSVVAFELEVVGYTISLAYCLHKELPFSAFGELAFLLIQALILVGCIYYYSQPLSVTTWVKAILYFAIAPTVFAGKIDPLLFEALYASKHLIFLSARIPQIWKNFRNKSTGQLSFLTCLMNFSGAMARVFTSIQANAPLSMLIGIVIALFTNGTIMSQILLYKSKGKEDKQVEGKKIS